MLKENTGWFHMTQANDSMQLSDSDVQGDYRVSVRLTRDDFERLERIQQILQAKKGRSVRVTQRSVIVEALEMCERELTRSRSGANKG